MWRKLKPYLNHRSLLNLVAIIVIGYIGLATLKVISRNFELQKEVDSLTSQISLLQLKNQQLTYQIAYYKTDAYADKAARDTLDLMSPGEHVVIFPAKVPTGPDLKPTPTSQPLTAKQALSNFQQWLYFLFKITPQSQ